MSIVRDPSNLDLPSAHAAARSTCTGRDTIWVNLEYSYCTASGFFLSGLFPFCPWLSTYIRQKKRLDFSRLKTERTVPRLIYIYNLDDHFFFVLFSQDLLIFITCLFLSLGLHISLKKGCSSLPRSIRAQNQHASGRSAADALDHSPVSVCLELQFLARL